MYKKKDKKKERQSIREKRLIIKRKDNSQMHPGKKRKRSTTKMGKAPEEVIGDTLEFSSGKRFTDIPSISISKDTPIEHVLKLGKSCEKCGHCCNYGSGYFLSEDIERISRKIGLPKEKFISEYLEEHEVFNTKVHKAKLDRVEGRPYGRCIFFDPKEGCTIHEIKPLHCAVAQGCGEYGQALSQWFFVNYLVNPSDPESIRQWASYLKTNQTIPGGELRQLIKDEKLLVDILSYKKFK